MKEEIRRLLREKNGVLLAHNYQPAEIQDVADWCGDSLELSMKAAQSDADLLVFCGVHFMAETAAILCPDKAVLLPRLDAGCPMAGMITPRQLEARKQTLPGIPVVTYVNSPAAVKALSTVCCTSANAVQVVESLHVPEVLMTPDRNLARYVASRTKTRVHFWDGCCPIHDAIRATDVHQAKNAHPQAIVMAHPECRMEVLELADQVLSTSGMLRFAKASNHREFIVGTETGLLHSLRKENPGKTFYPLSDRMLCPDMKKIALADVLHCLKTLQGRVRVPEDIRKSALGAVQRMLKVTG
ncbi:quinolinate synthase NadA [Desulfatirhabdium butyrativorans]|uniref:quinolinate synthase NadA n=1 Tax=Desulfatirhabdium butyrativorans TaxID=340467 RepID=UPI0004186526|nr:quinolinate synthase NadA [Desulfatirhabdium butyrativorans]